MGVLDKLKLNDGKDYDNFSEENTFLKNTITYLRAEVDKFKLAPLVVCDVKRIIENKAIIKLPNGNHFFVNIGKGVEIKVGDVVLAEQRSLTIVERLDDSLGYDVDSFLIIEKPNVSWSDVGGLEEQIRELTEVIELPLKRPDLFKKLGIEPPKGVLLYGLPGTGKTLLAKAIATSTNATFIEIVASELVQKYIGEGARLVRNIFELARKKAPCIIFIDEIDALAAGRIDVGVSGEREVQRTFMQLLTEIDGFNSLGDVRIIAATNRFDILDPAVLRPGRFDRLVEVELPTKAGRRQIFNIYMKNMNLDGLDLDVLLERTDGFTGADIKAICTEAGYFAIRDNREFIRTEDFLNAIVKLNYNMEYEDNLAGIYG
ncbi:AAA family ATPase [Candidatus Woesearchaeota archaeon]|nr:AAA family ATPase [Candidatus Woesearchaeota archaeon]